MVDEYKKYLKEVGEYGVVTEVKYPMVTVDGLPYGRIKENVIFEEGERGLIFSLHNERLKVLLLSRHSVKVGTKLTRTNTSLEIPVGPSLLGSLIDPLGNPISNADKYQRPQETRRFESIPPKIAFRTRIKRPFFTGVSVIDLLIPLGKGQRELIVGDRKTGKSAVLFTIVKKQIDEGAIVVYAAIGKKLSEVKKMKEAFDADGLSKNIIFIATTSDDPPPLITLTPQAAITVAEYFKDLKNDVLVVLDDLTTHAQFYREISLLGGSFPGKDSYPGNIFYIHANLLERAGNFKHPKGEVAITCLPVVELVDGDLTGYIATNVMGMTDGHIFFDSNAFAKGRRPAINIQLSVTRVGRQTQTPVGREINNELTKFLSEYERALNFSHFGAELSAKVKHTLKRGGIFYKFFDQHHNMIIPEDLEILIFGLIWSNFFDQEADDFIDEVRKRLLDAYARKDFAYMTSRIAASPTLYDLLTAINKNKDKLVKAWQEEPAQKTTKAA